MTVQEQSETKTVTLERIVIPRQDVVAWLQSLGVTIPPGEPDVLIERVEGVLSLVFQWRTVS